jgi:hypothetical protein
MATLTIDLAKTEKRSLKNDLAFGRANEQTIIGILNKHFNTEFKSTKDLYHTNYYPYDFEDEKKVFIEYKSRRNTYSAYPTTLIPKSKTDVTGYSRYVLCFGFTDGNYFIEYDAERFSKYKIQKIRTFRYGINDKPKDHYLIPIEDLIKIEC